MNELKELTKLLNNIVIHQAIARNWKPGMTPIGSLEPTTASRVLLETPATPVFTASAIESLATDAKVAIFETDNYVKLTTHDLVNMLEGNAFDKLTKLADVSKANSYNDTTFETLTGHKYTLTIDMLTTYNDHMAAYCDVQVTPDIHLSIEEQHVAMFFHHVACMIIVRHMGGDTDENSVDIDMWTDEVKREIEQNEVLEIDDIYLDVNQLWTNHFPTEVEFKLDPKELADAAVGSFSDRLLEQLYDIVDTNTEASESHIFTSHGRSAIVSLTGEGIRNLRDRLEYIEKELS